MVHTRTADTPRIALWPSEILQSAVFQSRGLRIANQGKGERDSGGLESLAGGSWGYSKIIKHVLRLDEFPPSYKENTPKERSIFAMVENFRLQYAYLYPDRKPLILCPLNECKVQPKYLYSSSTVLRFQQGTCFDFAILLCSILLGAGYNAYCVSGYAVKELCLQDQSRQQCPHIGTRKQKSQSAKKTPKSKYSVKPPKNLNSSFERQQAENLAAEERKQEEAKKRELEQEQPPPDPLHGLRVHCWVLVLAGKREIPENFFIDPLTGLSFSTADERFLGVESLWNHRNYWINMQDCRNGCKDMTFDLDDNVKWECILPTADEERKEEVDEEPYSQNEFLNPSEELVLEEAQTSPLWSEIV
ncbi:DRC7 protein, partial [Polypterus senegalus]